MTHAHFAPETSHNSSTALYDTAPAQGAISNPTEIDASATLDTLRETTDELFGPEISGKLARLTESETTDDAQLFGLMNRLAAEAAEINPHVTPSIALSVGEQWLASDQDEEVGLYLTFLIDTLRHDPRNNLRIEALQRTMSDAINEKNLRDEQDDSAVPSPTFTHRFATTFDGVMAEYHTTSYEAQLSRVFDDFTLEHDLANSVLQTTIDTTRLAIAEHTLNARREVHSDDLEPAYTMLRAITLMPGDNGTRREIVDSYRDMLSEITPEFPSHGTLDDMQAHREHVMALRELNILAASYMNSRQQDIAKLLRLSLIPKDDYVKLGIFPDSDTLASDTEAVSSAQSDKTMGPKRRLARFATKIRLAKSTT